MKYQIPAKLPPVFATNLPTAVAIQANREPGDAEIRQEIVTAVCNLSNHVSADGAQKAIKRYQLHSHLWTN